MYNLHVGPITQGSVYGKTDILHLPVKITVNKQMYGISTSLSLLFLNLYEILQVRDRNLKSTSVCFVLFPITTLVNKYIAFS